MPAHPSPAKAGRRERPSGEAARRRIIDGARRYFFSHGFRGVTMDDLAAELAMSKKTLYAHFDSKMALLQAVMTYKMSAVEADLDRRASRPHVGVLQPHGGWFTMPDQRNP